MTAKPKFGDVPANTILVGPVTKVLGARIPAVAKLHGWTKAKQEAWWRRTTFAWACGPCDPLVGVNFETLAMAQKDAGRHALEHRDITMKEI